MALKVFDIAIVGAGPAGIAAAVEATLLGIDSVVIFEKSSDHSSTIRDYYRDNKRVDKNWKGAHIELDGNIYFSDGTKETTIEFFGELIESHKIEARFNTGIDYVKKADDLFEVITERGYTYYAKNVIIAIGVMGKPNKPSYPIPQALKDRVNYNVNSAKNGEKIMVVGGGDSAVEYACALAKDSDVILSYRQSEFKRVNDINLSLLDNLCKSGELMLKLGEDIDYIEEVDGKISVSFFSGEKEIVDRMILAIGGASPVDFLRKCDLDIDTNGKPICDKNLQSSLNGLYIAGDIIAKKGGSIAMGLNHAYKIINHIKQKDN
ncbi:MAG: NAD(P)-binding domain-containing protein [Campylobacterales bacterium]